MRSAVDPRALAERVALAGTTAQAARTMMLDLDGTLAPIVARPEEAAVPPDVLGRLDDLCRAGWSVSVVSGRPAASARSLVPVPGVRVFGSHGLEGPWPASLRPRVGSTLSRRIARLAREAEAIVAREPGAWVERKPAGLAIHDRAVGASRRAAFRRALRAWLGSADLEGLEVLRGKRILELRARGIHKGRVLEALGIGDGVRNDASLVAVGDDRTDEDLFRVLAGRGLAVRVGPPGVATVARARLTSPAAVASFLRHLADASARGGS